MKKKFTFLIAALMLLTMINLPGKAVGQSTKTLQLSSNAKFGTTSPASLTQESVQWTCTKTGVGAIQNTYNSSYKGQQFGTGSAKWEGTFSTSGISGTITSVEIGANTGGTGKISVKVGNTDFVTGSNNLTTATVYQNTSNYTTVTFSGSASGNIVVTTWDAGSSTKAFYLNHITVTYTTGYSITYKHGMDATGDDFIDDGHTSGSSVTIKGVGGTDEPAFTKTGWHFVNWKNTEDGTSATLTLAAGDSYPITANTTLYAQWAKNTHAVALSSVADVTLTATYGSPTVTITEGNSASAVDYGTEITLNAADLASGFAFNWQITKTTGGEDVTASVLNGTTLTVPDYDITIGGTVTQICSVTYNCNGGTSDCPSTDPINVASGVTITLADAPTKSGYSFTGWNDGTNTYAAGANYTVNSTVTLTAQWAAGNTGTISFGKNDTPITGASVSLKDNLGYSWAVTTVGTTYFGTTNTNYTQVGSGNNRGESITFTMTLPISGDCRITSFSAKFNAYNGDTGEITLKVGNTEVATGSLDGTTNIEVSINSPVDGKQLMVIVEDGSLRVNCWWISYSYIITSTDPIINAPNTINLGSTDTDNEFAFDIVNPVSGKTLSATTSTSWISNVTVDNTNSKVTFTTSENASTTEDRSGSITLSYDGAEDKVVTINQSKVDYAAIPLNYNNGKDNLPTGFTQNGLGSDYSDANSKLKFDNTGDYLVLKLKEAPVSLTYNIKGNSFSANSTFKVQTSADGQTYEDLATYNTLAGSNLTVTHIDLDPSVRYIKWVYTARSSGNVGVGNIHATTGYDIYGSVTTSSLEPTSAKKCTIYNGGVLNVTGTLTNTTATNLIIEDGGQLITSSSNVAATVQKVIAGASAWGPQGETPYTPDGWYFIAAPIASVSVSDPTQTNLTSNANGNDYDLYQFNQAASGSEWQNYKKMSGENHANFSTMNKGQGYLYANKNGITLTFTGIMLNTSPTITLKNEGSPYELAGYNLIGNPFPCKATLSESTMSFYRLNNSNNIEPVAAGSAINPLEGILVQVEEQKDVTFNKVTPVTSSNPNHGNVQIALAQTVTTRGESSSQALDNAIVSFNEGSQLEKFYFGTQDANIYIPQGNDEYAIVSAAAQGEMPVNFKAAVDGTYTINVEADNVTMNYLHLIDNLTGADVDLLANPSYTFNARNDDYASRFRLVFSANGVNENETENGNFAFISNGQIILTEQGDVQVYDVMGRMISSHNNVSRITTEGMAAGVYVIRLTNGSETMTQKLVVK